MADHATRKRLLLVGLCVVAACVVAGVLFRPVGRAPGVDGTPEAWLRAGQRAYRDLAMFPLPEPSADGWRAGAALIRDLLSRAEVTYPLDQEADGSTLAVSDQQLGALLDEVSSFLAVRFVQSDAAVYTEWMQRNGYRLRTEDDWMPQDHWRAVFANFVGSPAPDDMTIPEAFEAVWRATGDGSRFGAGRPVAFAEPPAGMIVALGRGTFNRQFSGSVESAEHLGFDLWHGGVVGTCAMWFVAERSREDVIKARGSVLAARVAIIADFARHERHPFSTQWFFDPFDNRWRIWTVNVNNHRFERGAFCVAY